MFFFLNKKNIINDVWFESFLKIKIILNYVYIIVANLFLFPLPFSFLPNIEIETNNQSNLTFIPNPMTRIGITKFIPFSSLMYQT